MSSHQNLPDLPSAISSQESADGQEPYSSRGGVQTDLFGQEALHANHSQQQGKEREKMTSDTSGLSSLILSESANLQQCLVNKLQQLSDMNGSMIYKTTLKRKVTPAGQSYYHLAASARITKGTDSSSWPTPRVADTNNLNNSPTVVKDRVTKGRATVAEIASHNINSWPTPSTRDHKGGYTGGRIRNGKVSTDTLDVAAQLTPWATPTATDPKRGTKPPRPQDTGIPLTQQVSGLTPWPTPQANKNTKNSKDPQKMKENGAQSTIADAAWMTKDSGIYGKIPKSSTAETESTVPSQLNPRFSLWLMGYPIEWAYSGERVTPLSRKRQRKS